MTGTISFLSSDENSRPIISSTIQIIVTPSRPFPENAVLINSSSSDFRKALYYGHGDIYKNVESSALSSQNYTSILFRPAVFMTASAAFSA